MTDRAPCISLLTTRSRIHMHGMEMGFGLDNTLQRGEHTLRSPLPAHRLHFFHQQWQSGSGCRPCAMPRHSRVVQRLHTYERKQCQKRENTRALSTSPNVNGPLATIRDVGEYPSTLVDVKITTFPAYITSVTFTVEKDADACHPAQTLNPKP